MNNKGFTVNSYYLVSRFCDLNGLALFQSHFQKVERFLDWIWNRLANYRITWAWDCSNTAWPSMMSRLWWAYIVVQIMVVKKIQKLIVNFFVSWLVE